MSKPTAYGSIKAAAAGEGISEAIFKRARDLGCPGFDHGRVRRKVVLKFIAENGDRLIHADEGANLKEQKISEEVRKLKIRNDRDAHLLVEKAKIIQFFNDFASEFRAELHQTLENVYPTIVTGMDPPQIRIKGKQLADKLDEIGNGYATKLETIE